MKKIEKQDEKILFELAEKYDKYSLTNGIRNVYRKIWELGASDRERERLERKKRYEEQRKAKYERGQKLKDVIKPGDIVKVEGTKDNVGVREVLETDNYRIIARKLKRGINKVSTNELRKGDRIWVRDTYITTHQWDKVVKKLDIKIH